MDRIRYDRQHILWWLALITALIALLGIGTYVTE